MRACAHAYLCTGYVHPCICVYSMYIHKHIHIQTHTTAHITIIIDDNDDDDDDEPCGTVQTASSRTAPASCATWRSARFRCAAWAASPPSPLFPARSRMSRIASVQSQRRRSSAASHWLQVLHDGWMNKLMID